jgi:hypothetical protein
MDREKTGMTLVVVVCNKRRQAFLPPSYVTLVVFSMGSG